MNDKVVEFGYNTEKSNFGYTAWEFMGTKYNFNIEGRFLGVFSNDDKNYLLSEITRSYGDDCMVGTVDAREIAIESENNSSYILVSNNELSAECMNISRMLSSKRTKEELALGESIEKTTDFQKLAKLGIDLEKRDIQLDDKNCCLWSRRRTF